MDEIEGRILGRQLMEVAEAAYLTTNDEHGFPHTRAMFNPRNRSQFAILKDVFAAHRDDFLILFTTNTSSKKVEQVKRNPAGCAFYCVPAEFRGLMLAGSIETVTDTSLKEKLWQEGWERYYALGREDPDYAVLGLFPERGEYYHRLDRVNISFGAEND